MSRSAYKNEIPPPPPPIMHFLRFSARVKKRVSDCAKPERSPPNASQSTHSRRDDERRPCSWLPRTAAMASETETRHEREPETFQGAEPFDARRANPRARPRRSARHSAQAFRWHTARDLRARKPLRQNAVRTPQNANAPAGGPGAFTLNRSARQFRARLLKESWIDAVRIAQRAQRENRGQAAGS